MQTFRTLLAVLALLCGGAFFICRAISYVWFDLLENYAGEQMTLFRLLWGVEFLALSTAIIALALAALLPVRPEPPQALHSGPPGYRS